MAWCAYALPTSEKSNSFEGYCIDDRDTRIYHTWFNKIYVSIVHYALEEVVFLYSYVYHLNAVYIAADDDDDGRVDHLCDTQAHIQNTSTYSFFSLMMA